MSREISRVRIARVIARLNVGGPAQHVAIAARGLASFGYETTVIAGRVGPGEGDMSDLARGAGAALIEIPGLGRNIRPLSDLGALLALVRLFRRLEPRIVHTHTAKAGFLGRIAALIAGVPRIVHTFHGHVLEGYFPPLASLLIRVAERFLAAWTDRIVAVSPRQARELVLRFRIAPRRRIRVIPVGVDLEPYLGANRRRGELRRELGVRDEVPLVGTVGRLVPIKDVDTLLRAFARVASVSPEATLAVVGEGDERTRLETLARDLGLAERARFLGLRRDLVPVYADLDLMVLSSRNEGTPLALIEAFAAGVPAVSTAVGGIPDLLEVPPLCAAPFAIEPPAVLVPPGDPDSLARAVLALLCDPARRARMAASARAAATYFSSERLVANLAALYSELLAH